MKRTVNIFYPCCLILLGLAVFSCEKEEKTETGLKTGQIEYKALPDENNNIEFSIDAEEITIDWGDGVIETFTGPQNFLHTYENREFQTIKIDTKKMTFFFDDNGPITSLEDPDKEIAWEAFKKKSDELRFGNCPYLKAIQCASVGLAVLKINRADSLIVLDCSLNNLNSLKLNNCPALNSLFCMFNNLRLLEIQQCKKLTNLWCLDNQLTQLDLQEQQALFSLVCGHNQIKDWNLNNHKELQYLVCDYVQSVYRAFDIYHLEAGNFQLDSAIFPPIYHNKLRSVMDDEIGIIPLPERDKNSYPPLEHLNVKGCNSLHSISCNNNQLKEINIEDCVSLQYLSCNYNQLTTSALNSILDNLPNGADNAEIAIKGNSGVAGCNKDIAINKGWKVIE